MLGHGRDHIMGSILQNCGSVSNRLFRSENGPRSGNISGERGGGRKAMEPRKVFEGDRFRIANGVPVEGTCPKASLAVPAPSINISVEWKRQGVFTRLWRKGLAEYDEMEGIAWRWQSIDGAMVKAPLAQEAVGPNPTDRGKKWDETKPPRRREWNPAVVSRKRGPAA